VYEPDPPPQLQQGVLLSDVGFSAIGKQLPALALTPACDLEHNKVPVVTACAVVDAIETIRRVSSKNLTDEEGQPATKVSTTKLGNLKNLINQLMDQRLPRFHWLAPFPGTHRPQLADFAIVTTIRVDTATQLPRIARLASPYREEAAARYVAYMGRVGTPDPTPETKDGWIRTVLGDLLPDQEP
jgi:hypothetical protein